MALSPALVQLPTNLLFSLNSISFSGSVADSSCRHGLYGGRRPDCNRPPRGRRDCPHGVEAATDPADDLVVLVRLLRGGHLPGPGAALVQAGGDQGPGQQRPATAQGRRRDFRDPGVQPRTGRFCSLLHDTGEGCPRSNHQGR